MLLRHWFIYCMTSIVDLFCSHWLIYLLTPSCFTTWVLDFILRASWLRSGSTFHLLIRFICRVRGTAIRSGTWIAGRWIRATTRWLRLAPGFRSILWLFLHLSEFNLVFYVFVHLPNLAVVAPLEFTFVVLRLSKVRETLSNHIYGPAVVAGLRRGAWGWRGAGTYGLVVVNWTLRSPHDKIVSAIHF